MNYVEMSEETSINQNLKKCSLYGVFDSCSSYISSSKRRDFQFSRFSTTYISLGFEHWPSDLVNINDLRDDAVAYLVGIGVISKSNEGSYDISECQLLLNRLSRYVDVQQPCLKICMYSLLTEFRDK